MDLYKNSNLSKVEHWEGIKTMINDPIRKTTWENENCIFQLPLLQSYSNFKLLLSYKYLKWGWTPMEEDLKILKVEYLSNHLLDHTQVLNL